MFSQDTLLFAVKVNGVGPPAEMSTKRFPLGTKGSMDIDGSAQLYI